MSMAVSTSAICDGERKLHSLYNYTRTDTHTHIKCVYISKNVLNNAKLWNQWMNKIKFITLIKMNSSHTHICRETRQGQWKCARESDTRFDGEAFECEINDMQFIQFLSTKREIFPFKSQNIFN